MENQNFDEFDIMAARDWVSAVIRNHKDRLSLERLNNQIRLAKEDSGVRMMEGIEALADLLGVKLGSGRVMGFTSDGKRLRQDKRGKTAGYNAHTPNKFNQFQQNDYDFERLEKLVANKAHAGHSGKWRDVPGNARAMEYFIISFAELPPGSGKSQSQGARGNRVSGPALVPCTPSGPS